MWRQSRQSNSGDSGGGEHDDLVARLAAAPRPSTMPAEMEDRVRARLSRGLAAPVRAPFGGIGGWSGVSGGILGGLPFTTQAIVAALLLSVAGWLVVRDVQAYSSPYDPFSAAYTGHGVEECAPPAQLPTRHRATPRGDHAPREATPRIAPRDS